MRNWTFIEAEGAKPQDSSAPLFAFEGRTDRMS
jgi:hypothetical protein